MYSRNKSSMSRNKDITYTSVKINIDPKEMMNATRVVLILQEVEVILKVNYSLNKRENYSRQQVNKQC